MFRGTHNSQWNIPHIQTEHKIHRTTLLWIWIVVGYNFETLKVLLKLPTRETLVSCNPILILFFTQLLKERFFSTLYLDVCIWKGGNLSKGHTHVSSTAHLIMLQQHPARQSKNSTPPWPEKFSDAAREAALEIWLPWLPKGQTLSKACSIRSLSSPQFAHNFIIPAKSSHFHHKNGGKTWNSPIPTCRILA